jgi:glycosyltransferase involved in cell wall biosynthesis
LPNALDTLLDAAALLSKEKLTFILVGDGHEQLRLQVRCRTEGLCNVMMFGSVPKAQIVELLATVDMAYLGAPRYSIYRFGVSPNKMIDYMMACVPILYAIEAGNDPVAEAGCGLSVPAESPKDLAKSILELASLSSSARMAMGEKGRSYALAHHTYDVLAKKFIKAVESVESRE